MSAKMRHKSHERRVSGATQHINSSEDLGDDQDTDSLEIKPPQAKIMTNYASHRDMGNGSYRTRNDKNDNSRNNNKHKNSISIKSDTTGGSIDRETVRLHNERLERSGNTSWRSKEGNSRSSTNILDRRDLQATYRYQKYQEASCREDNYHYHQSHNHYYNHHTQSYHRLRQDAPGYHSSRSTVDDFIAVPSSSSGSNSKNANSSNYVRQLEFYSSSDDHKITEEETYTERRKRRKAIANEAEEEEADEQTEHDLRSRLLNKRYKFIKGHNATNSEKMKKPLSRSEKKAALESSVDDTQNMEELERERLLLRSLLKGTYKESHDIEQSLINEDVKTNVRSKRTESARTTHKTQAHAIRGLSPGSVAASVTAGLKDFAAMSFRYDSTNKISSSHARKSIKTERQEAAAYAEDLGTDGGSELFSDEEVQQLHDSKSNEESDEFDSEVNNHSNSKAKKQKKKKKKKKKRRSSANNEELQMPANNGNQQVVEELVVVHHSSSSERSTSDLHRHKSQAVVSISSTKSSTGSPDSSKANRNVHVRRSGMSTASRSVSISSDQSQSVESVSASASSCTSRATSPDHHMRSTSRNRSASLRRSLSMQSRSRSTHSVESTEKELDAQKYKANASNKQFPNFDVKDKVLQLAADDDEFKLDKTQLTTTTTSASAEELVLDKEDLNLPNYYPGVQGCRSVEEFQCLNRIEEGTYGVVYRAKDKRTNEVVALKRLKMEKEKEGFPITSLREINTLLKGQHPNIVTVREIVVGSNMDKIFIVMDYVEHDLKSLMETMKQRKQNFLPSEVKCIIQQLLRAVAHLHDNWILHRDLKTSNLLLSHKGILKVGDFGLAREYGSPLKRYTLLVVTLWYRAPELLLCASEYSTPIDMWSVGCIFAELLLMRPLFTGESEIDQINRIFKELGTPNDDIWPGFKELPAVKNILIKNPQFTKYTASNLRKRFAEKVSDAGLELLQGLLTFDPAQRLTAETGLRSTYFTELPPPTDPSMFPTWPAKSELGVRKSASSPRPPSGGKRFKGHEDVHLTNNQNANAMQNNAGNNARIYSSIITGNKKTGTNTGFVLNAGIDQRPFTNRMGFNAKF